MDYIDYVQLVCFQQTYPLWHHNSAALDKSQIDNNCAFCSDINIKFTSHSMLICFLIVN